MVRAGPFGGIIASGAGRSNPRTKASGTDSQNGLYQELPLLREIKRERLPRERDSWDRTSTSEGTRLVKKKLASASEAWRRRSERPSRNPGARWLIRADSHDVSVVSSIRVGMSFWFKARGGPPTVDQYLHLAIDHEILPPQDLAHPMARACSSSAVAGDEVRQQGG